MSKETPIVAFESKAVQHALGELAASGPSYVRLGALKAMASMLRDTHDPHAQSDPHRDRRMDAALDEVETMIEEARLAAERRKAADSDAQADPDGGEQQEDRVEQQEEADDDDKPP